MKSSHILFYALAAGILIFSALFFGFSIVSDNGVSLIRGKTAPAENSLPAPVKISAPSEQNDNPPVIDYSKILEKYKGRDVERVATDKKLIALTFDGGGNDEGAGKIIRTLSDNSIRSTFFLTGRFVEKFPAVAEEIKNSGAEIANHSYSHKDFTSLSADEAEKEMSQMKAVAEKNSIVIAPFFRFPYGARNKETIALANRLGYTAVRWTTDSLGWQGKVKDHDVKFVADRVAGQAKPGAIVLMHLGSAQDKSALDADALPDIVKTLREQGYQFVSLSELFGESL